MPLRRSLSFLALALLAFPALAGAQNAGTIRGRVSDAATGAPVAGVQVRVEGTALGTQSRPDGTYSITGAPPGSQFVMLRRVGYAPERVAVTVPTVGFVARDFAIRSVAATLSEVVVTALGQTTERRSVVS